VRENEIPEWLRDVAAADGYLGLRYSVWPRAAKKALPEQRQKSTKTQKSQEFPPELEALRREVLSCQKCRIASQRRNAVFGEGNPSAKLLFVGEAPGEQEDIQGRPFVGRAGQLLDRLLEEAGYSRNSVFIANVLKCRPPGNRTPRADEILNCHPFLMRQLRIINPRVVCALGAVAAQTLLKRTGSMSRLRGRFFRVGSFWVVPTYHPAYLLRNPAATDTVRNDIQLAIRVAEG